MLEGDEDGGGVCEILCRCVVGVRGDSLGIWRWGMMRGIRGREMEAVENRSDLECVSSWRESALIDLSSLQQDWAKLAPSSQLHTHRSPQIPAFRRRTHHKSAMVPSHYILSKNQPDCARSIF